MYAATQTAQLRIKALTAIYRQYMKALHVLGVGLKGFGYLNGKFAGRCKHKDLRCFQFHVDARQQRQGEGGGFTGTCLRQA